MLFGSLYVGYASWNVFKRMEAGVKDDPYRLKYQEVHIWRFITIVTIGLQDATAIFVGALGAYQENYELMVTYALITAIVFVLNLVNTTLLKTIVSPVFSGAVFLIAFIFSRYLKRSNYEINDKKNRSRV